MSEPNPELSVVTGAFGYTGKYIAQRLLSRRGGRVRTLTGHPDRPNPFGSRIEVAPLDFDNPDELRKNLQGATTLYNTYWVRFERGPVGFDLAVANTKKLIDAARQAGVQKIVHISVSNPSEDSPLPYFKGKAQVESAIVRSGLPYAIIRPTVIFGREDILINNIAWLLRRMPLFAVPGRGDYRLQPVFAEDVAEIAVNSALCDESIIADAAGPEVYTFDELVRVTASTVRSRARIVHMPPRAALLMTRLLGWLVRDVVLTQGEVEGLMTNLLVSAEAPAGRTSFRAWLEQNAQTVGAAYASELARHFR